MHLNDARGSLDRNIFYGALGQSRNYTIQYKLKSGYTLESIASQISDRNISIMDRNGLFRYS